MIQYHTWDNKILSLLILARAVNPLSRRFQRALADMLERLEAQADRLDGVIIGFNDSPRTADHELDHLMALTPAQSDDCTDMLAAYQGLLRRLEMLGKPVIAALDGGLEGHALTLALACHHRFALAGTRFSMPQVTYGMLPSGGAIVRMVRCIGVPAAQPLLLDGAIRNALQACQAGLLDAVVDDEAALAALVQQVIGTGDQGCGSRPPCASRHGGQFPCRHLASGRCPGDDNLAPAPAPDLEAPARAAIWTVMTAASELSFEAALQLENAHFCRIAVGKEAKNLMRLHGAAPAAGSALETALKQHYGDEAARLVAEGWPPACIEAAAHAAGMAWAPYLPPAHGEAPAAAGIGNHDEAAARLLYIQCIAALRAQTRGELASADLADRISVAHCGFPAHTGGVLRYIDYVGPALFAERAAALALACGERFRLPPGWRQRLPDGL